jgi:hypothetical protein
LVHAVTFLWNICIGSGSLPVLTPDHYPCSEMQQT